MYCRSILIVAPPVLTGSRSDARIRAVEAIQMPSEIPADADVRTQMCAVKAYKYQLKTNTKFVAGCSVTLDVCRELYNAALQERRDAYQINGLSINYQAQAVQLPQIKQVREDVGEIHSQVLQDTLRRVDKTFDAFFRRCQSGETPGYPRFKPASRYDSFTYPQSGFRLEGDKLHLSKIGSCRVRL